MLGQGRAGVRLASLIGCLRAVYRLPLAQIQALLAQVYGLALSEGGILARLAEALAPVRAAIIAQTRASPAQHMDETGWRQLTWRWGIFFLALAVLNELVWRNASTAAWVSFKVWGIIPLIFLFALAQTPFVMKHHIEPEKTAD